MAQHKQGNPDLNIVLRSDPPPSRAQPTSRASSSTSRLLFVEVREPRGARRQGLKYDRSARELKSHVMLVTNEGKRRRKTDDADEEDDPLLQAVAVSHVPPDFCNGLISDIDQEHVDPFDVLPVKSTPELHTAIRFYFENYPGVTPLTDDILVCHRNAYARESMEWNRVQFSFCQNEKTAYYMLLLSWQLQKDLASNAKDMSLATRRYFVWAIKSIREEMPISQTGTKIPESCAGMVAALGVAQNWFGAWKESQRHFQAMHAIVAARGGYSTLSSIAQRCLKWAEYHPCAAQLTRPAFPRLPLLPLPFRLLKDSQAAHRRTMALLPPHFADTELSVVLLQLHQVSLGQVGYPKPPVASVIDDAQYRLLNELARWVERPAASPSAVWVDLVYSAVLHAAHTYVWGALTLSRSEMAMNGIFVTRIRDALKVSCLIETWRSTASLESLLWVLFVGWTTASQRRGDEEGAISAAMWFLKMIVEAGEALHISGEEELCETLRAFPWSDRFCREPCSVLWNGFLHQEDADNT